MKIEAEQIAIMLSDGRTHKEMAERFEIPQRTLEKKIYEAFREVYAVSAAHFVAIMIRTKRIK